MLQSVETSLPFVHAMLEQLVLWVVSPGVGTHTMGEDECAAEGRVREWRAVKKVALMESLLG